MKVVQRRESRALENVAVVLALVAIALAVAVWLAGLAADAVAAPPPAPAAVVATVPAQSTGWTWDDRFALKPIIELGHADQVCICDGGNNPPHYGEQCSFWQAGWESNGLRCINVAYGLWEWR